MNNTLTILNDLKTITDKQDIKWKKLEGSTVLITGASGMIGQYIIKTLEFLNRFKDFKINIITISRDGLLTEDVMLKCDYFFHCASPSGASEFIEDEVFECNVIGTLNVLSFFKNNMPKSNLKGFVFLSSGEALHPSNCYGEAKRMTEKLLTYHQKKYKIPCYITRLDHTFAPTMNLEKDKRVFASFVKYILDREPIEVTNNLARRTFTYITDAIDGILRAVLNGEATDYNISNHKNNVQIGCLASDLASQYNIRCNYGLSSHIDNIKPLPIDKLKALGYNPKVDVIEGFKRVIAHFKEIENAK